MRDTDVGCHTLSSYTEAQVALSRSAYSVSEGGTVTVCAEVARTSVSCQINFPFSIKVFTEDGTAGIIIESIDSICTDTPI